MFYLFCVHTYICMCACHSIFIGVRGQLSRVHSLLLCGPQRLNSGHQAWYETPLAAEPSLKCHHLTKYANYRSGSKKEQQPVRNTKSLQTVHPPNPKYSHCMISLARCGITALCRLNSVFKV